MSNEPKLITWRGRRLTELTREELIQACEWASGEIDRLRARIKPFENNT